MVLLGALLAFGLTGPDAGPLYAHSEDPEGHGKPSSKVIGATVYKHMCKFCHGEDGNGGGKAMAYLYPWQNVHICLYTMAPMVLPVSRAWPL